MSADHFLEFVFPAAAHKRKTLGLPEDWYAGFPLLALFLSFLLFYFPPLSPSSPSYLYLSFPTTEPNNTGSWFQTWFIFFPSFVPHSKASDYVLKVAGRNSYIHGPYELIQFSPIVRMLTKGNDVELGLVRMKDPTDDLPRDIPDVRREGGKKRRDVKRGESG